MANTTGKKVQVPVLGGLRKVIRVGGGGEQATTISGLAGQTISLDQLRTLLGLGSGNSSQVQPGGGGGGGASAQIIVGPGLTGGGIVTGAVKINLPSIPMWIGDDGGAPDGDPGPPGVAGIRGNPGPTGPPAVISQSFPLMLPEDGADADFMPVQGAQGARGPQGIPGTGGSGGGGSGTLWLPYEDSVDESQTLILQPQIFNIGGGGSANITPDTHPAVANACDDEFEFGTTLDTTGSRFAGASPWTIVNQNGNSMAVSNGSLAMGTTVGTNDCVTYAYQPLSGNWEIRGKGSVQPIGAPNSNQDARSGLLIANGSGAIYLLGWYFNSGTPFYFLNWYSSPTSAASGSLNLGNGPTAGVDGLFMVYWRILYDGTNFKFYISRSGVFYRLMTTVSPATFFGGPAVAGGIFTSTNATTLSNDSPGVWDWFRRIT